MKKTLLILSTILSFNALSVENSPTGKVTGYYTGWAADQVRVTIAGADYSQGNCPVKDGYVTTLADNSGYQAHTSALLAAFMSGKPVSVTVNGCLNDRPRIWGVNIAH